MLQKTVRGDKLFTFLWSLVIGGIIGWIAGMIAGKNIPGGVLGNIIAGFVGAWLGALIFGNWGPVVANFAIIPAIIGAILLVFIVSFIMRAFRKTTD